MVNGALSPRINLYFENNFKDIVMSSLLDLLLKADNNELSNNIAQTYGLEQEQANTALQALMPAFSQGLKRNVETPKDFGAFMQALANGNHAQYTNNPKQAFTQNGIDEGNQILGHLFKSKELSRKIAEKASKSSGVSADTLKQMLPSLAPLIMGALSNNMQNPQSAAQHFGGSGGSGGANPLGRILEELMKGGLNRGTGGNSNGGPNSGSGGNNPLGDILEQMMGRKGGQSRQGGQSNQNGRTSRDDRLGDIFGEMLDGKTGNFNQPDFQDNFDQDNSNDDPYADAPLPDTQPENRSAPKRTPQGGGLEDLFGEMFRPSRQENPKYDRDVESIFDEFLGSNNR